MMIAAYDTADADAAYRHASATAMIIRRFLRMLSFAAAAYAYVYLRYADTRVLMPRATRVC